MKKFLLILPLITGLAACETQGQNQLAGAATGALIGSAVSSDNDRVKGAIIGGAAGLAAGTLIGQRDTNGRCLYQRPDGTRYYASC
jgi:outer membrane lipoprotein SlyB